MIRPSKRDETSGRHGRHLVAPATRDFQTCSDEAAYLYHHTYRLSSDKAIFHKIRSHTKKGEMEWER